jgi:hypothetical protein
VGLRLENPGMRDIALFPGVELTVSGGVHVLGIFDPAESAETINSLIARCNYDGTRGGSTQTADATVVRAAPFFRRQSSRSSRPSSSILLNVAPTLRLHNGFASMRGFTVAQVIATDSILRPISCSGNQRISSRSNTSQRGPTTSHQSTKVPRVKRQLPCWPLFCRWATSHSSSTSPRTTWRTS